MSQHMAGLAWLGARRRPVGVGGAVSADSVRISDTRYELVCAYGGIRILMYPMYPVSVHTGPAEYP